MKKMLNRTRRLSEQLTFVGSIMLLFVIGIDFGYPDIYWNQVFTETFYVLYSALFCYRMYAMSLVSHRSDYYYQKGRVLVTILAVFLAATSTLNVARFVIDNPPDIDVVVAVAGFLLAITDISERIFRIQEQRVHPALAFVLSFFVLIILGTSLLLLPLSTPHGISAVDALFTATSAVCVTGLIVVDTGSDFTRFGQVILLMLIQFGGLGMLTFTNLFGLFFRGSSSLQNRLILKNRINASQVGNTFRRLIQIIIFTLLVEALGATIIYFSIGSDLPDTQDRFFFSIFHAISAFCNAGFSTLSNSLYEPFIRHKYAIHLIIAGLIILGGIGFGVVIDYYRYLVKWIRYRIHVLKRITRKEKALSPPDISLNTTLIVRASLVLWVGGTVMFFLLEQKHILAGGSSFGQWVTSVFTAVTPRTAGFNTVPIDELRTPTIVLLLFLMWIGASPGSTGGGVKTTTFALCFLNIVQQIKGTDRMRVGWKEVPPEAQRRAMSILTLSLAGIGTSSFLLLLTDGHLGLRAIFFECVSAFSTVGLTLGITGSLSTPGKIIITLAMFVGRVGFLTLLTGIIRQLVHYKHQPGRYPEEEIFIN